MPFAPCISICFVLVFSCDLFFYFKIIATAVQVQIFCMRFDSFNCVLGKLNILVIQAFRLEETGFRGGFCFNFLQYVMHDLVLTEED